MPLAGKGGSPLKLANRKPSAEKVNMNLYNFRANLHKESLKLEHNQQFPEPKDQPRTNQQLTDKGK